MTTNMNTIYIIFTLTMIPVMSYRSSSNAIKILIFEYLQFSVRNIITFDY